MRERVRERGSGASQAARRRAALACAGERLCSRARRRTALRSRAHAPGPALLVRLHGRANAALCERRRVCCATQVAQAEVCEPNVALGAAAQQHLRGENKNEIERNSVSEAMISPLCEGARRHVRSQA